MFYANWLKKLLKFTGLLKYTVPLIYTIEVWSALPIFIFPALILIVPSNITVKKRIKNWRSKLNGTVSYSSRYTII